MTKEEAQARAAAIRAEGIAYRAMTPVEKIIHLAQALKEEMGRTGLDTTCDAGRECCIDCGLQEILNAARKIEAIKPPETTE